MDDQRDYAEEAANAELLATGDGEISPEQVQAARKGREYYAARFGEEAAAHLYGPQQ